MTKDQLRLARLRRANLNDLATQRELVHLAHNDDATLLALINAAIFANEVTITKTVGEQITFSFDNLSGTDFVVGEPITNNDTGATAVVVSNTDGVLVIGTLAGGLFHDNDEIEGQSANTADIASDATTADSATTLTYANLAVGIFEFGETVTDTITGATGVVVSGDDFTTLVLKDVTGQFNDGDAIEGGTSGATADMDGDATYTTIDLDNATDATAFVIASANTNLAIGNFSNAPSTPFKVIASGSTIFEFIDGTIKTVGGEDAVLKGSTGDFAIFETRGGVIKEVSTTVYV